MHCIRFPVRPMTIPFQCPLLQEVIFTYKWLVTQDKTFIDATGLVATPEVVGANHIFATGTGYNDVGTASSTINITWSSFTHDAANPVFLVIYVENTVTCMTDNIEVYIIEPKHAFTLDIANIALDGSTQSATYATCVSPVVFCSLSMGLML